MTESEEGEASSLFNNKETYLFAGLCSLLACCISLHQIKNHLQHYTQPTYQRYIIRIIFMCPVYALVSFVSVCFREHAVYIDTIRDVYEAWIIYNFLSLMLAYVGGPGAVVNKAEGAMIEPSWIWGTCCLPPIPIDGKLMRRCKQGALQFVFLKPALALTTLILETKDLYQEGVVAYYTGYFWIQIIYNFSYAGALYALMLFYLGTKVLLEPYKPVLKFLVVKSVVFLTFWQGMGCTALQKAGVMDDPEDAKSLQNILICVEMMITSVALLFAFPHKIYIDPNRVVSGSDVQTNDLRDNLAHAISVKDVVSDAVHQFAPMYNKYILYSEKTTSGPKRGKTVRTRAMLGKELEEHVSKHTDVGEVVRLTAESQMVNPLDWRVATRDEVLEDDEENADPDCGGAADDEGSEDAFRADSLMDDTPVIEVQQDVPVQTMDRDGSSKLRKGGDGEGSESAGLSQASSLHDSQISVSLKSAREAIQLGQAASVLQANSHSIPKSPSQPHMSGRPESSSGKFGTDTVSDGVKRSLTDSTKSFSSDVPEMPAMPQVNADDDDLDHMTIQKVSLLPTDDPEGKD